MNISTFALLAATTLITTLIGIIIHEAQKYIKEQRRRDVLHKYAILHLLEHNITQAYERYCAFGQIPRFALRCVENMYKEYTGLGGNGLISEMVKRLRALPCADTGGKERLVERGISENTKRKEESDEA